VAIDALTESIDTISKTVAEIEIEKQKAITEIKEAVKQDIDASIIQIIKSTEISAFDLQKSIDDERTQMFEHITQTIETLTPIEISNLTELQESTNVSLQIIQDNLESTASTTVSFEHSKRIVGDTLNHFQQTLNDKKDIIDSRQGQFVFEDTDGDGVSDYDEMYIYQTDPENATTTVGSSRNDGQKIAAGINPLSASEEPIKYQDPLEDKESFVSASYRVDKVQLIKDDNTSLVFEGTALPNTFVTLYIYSSKEIATTRTDASGKWSYEFTSDIDNGEHQIFVASVNSSGKIITRSNPTLFTKSADAATIGIAGNLNNSMNAQNFLKDNFILITLAILIAVVVLGMMFIGNHKNIKSAVSELRNEVNPKV
jgi:hypothetical protein